MSRLERHDRRSYLRCRLATRFAERLLAVIDDGRRKATYKLGSGSRTHDDCIAAMPRPEGVPGFCATSILKFTKIIAEITAKTAVTIAPAMSTLLARRLSRSRTTIHRRIRRLALIEPKDSSRRQEG